MARSLYSDANTFLTASSKLSGPGCSGMFPAAPRKKRHLNLGCRRGAHRHGKIADSHLACDHVVRRRYLVLESRRQGRVSDPGTDLGSRLGQGSNIVRIELRKQLLDTLVESLLR